MLDNYYINFLLNKSDFLVRFFYTKLNLNKFFKNKYRSNIKKTDDNFKQLNETINKFNFNFEDKICLEIGPGNSLIVAYNLLMNGAKKVILVDKYPRWNNSYTINELQKKEINYIKKKYNKPNLFFIKDDKLDKQYIKFIRGDITQISLTEQIDFVLSFSVLEHIKNIEEVVSSLSSILSNNGLSYHFIDLRDHYNFNSPFLFYKHSNYIWDRFLTKEGVSYTNRLRYDDYIRIFFNNNFSVIYENKIFFSLDKNQHISADFINKDLSILKIGQLSILLRKLT